MRLGGIRKVRLVALTGALVMMASACRWTSYGSDYANSRTAAGETIIRSDNAGTLHELWRVDGTVGSTSTPAVYGNTVYFGTWDGKLRAVSSADGSPRWTRQLTASIIDDSPLVYGNNVYVGDATGNLHAVDRATGASRWTRELDPHPYTRIFSSPVGVADLIIVGVASVEIAAVPSDYTARGSIVALDANTGAERWRVYTTNDDEFGGAGVSVWSTAAIDEGREMLYIGTGNSYEPPASPRSDALMAIKYRTGAVQWVRQFTPERRVHDLRAQPLRARMPTSARLRTCSASALATSSVSATRPASTRFSTAVRGRRSGRAISRPGAISVGS